MISDFNKNAKIELKKGDSVDAILSKANLNWDVQQIDAFINFEGKKTSIGRKALIRSDNGKVLTVTGPNWKPVQNRDIVKFFKDFSDETGSKLERIGQIRGGRGIWAQASIGSDFKLAGGDEVKGYVILSSFHAVGHATSVMTSATRLWCDNSLAMAFKESKDKYRQNHMAEFEFSAAREAVGFAKEEIVKFSLEAKALKQLKMSEFETVRLFAQQFVEEEKDKLDESVKAMMENEELQPLRLKQVLHSYVKAPGASVGNGWGALNAITHWADHVAGSDAEARFNRATFGDNSRLKQQVKKQLLEMV